MVNKDLAAEMALLKEYFEFELQIPDKMYRPILVAKDRETGETHEYALSSIKDLSEGSEAANMALADLKAKSRNGKIGKLGI